MKKYRLDDFWRGWFAGSFKDALIASNMEIGVQRYSKDECHPAHYHKLTKEYNVVLSGSCRFLIYNNASSEISITEKITLTKGDILLIEENEIVSFEALQDCEILCVKTNSDPKDKYLI